MFNRSSQIVNTSYSEILSYVICGSDYMVVKFLSYDVPLVDKCHFFAMICRHGKRGIQPCNSQ